MDHKIPLPVSQVLMIESFDFEKQYLSAWRACVTNRKSYVIAENARGCMGPGQQYRLSRRR
jgi:hypothetical protein